MKERINSLIEKGQTFTFANNCERKSHGAYTRASDEYLAWIATVEDFIVNFYGHHSSAFKLYSTFNTRNLNGFKEDAFTLGHNILIGALKSCFNIQARNTSKELSCEIQLQNLFNKFHSVTIQLRNRYNNKSTLDVQDEYDVQDLLHALLKLHFEDIRKEEWTPSYAGGSSRMDFLLKDEKIVIEVKKTRVGINDKELGKQLIEDKAKYQAHPDCKRLICFTYDPEGRIINPKGIQNDLNQNTTDFKVEIIIKPEH